MLFIYWAIAIVIAAFVWFLFAKGYIIRFIFEILIGFLFPKKYWTPPVDSDIVDEHDIYW